MSSGTKWILIIIGLLVGNVLAMGVLIAAAHTGGSHVLPQYYDRAVHYDDRIDQEARNRALAWQIGASIERGVMTVTARDRAGAPLEGATVKIEGLERARDARQIGGELSPTRAGEYRGTVGGHGWIDLTIAIDRGGDRYVHQLALEAR